ncbi:phosphatidylglycerophosphatase [Limimonas halophila]|uniref:Phosphatidylglycerophosphatase A n=1 Tax=Limimonas halophila TaxID=1082479 RepID=A0A1G7NCD9_9PROT|nr:phosphatidylglycerophosphatase A [Limimonas halophila]SDF71601.1 phosphatidylglycerophosphatase [Limimonas halophila]
MARPATLSPIGLIATWFGSGLLPTMPGTWGSLATLPPAALLAWGLGAWGPALLAVAATALGVWAGGRYAGAAGEHDPGEVVIDEVAGQAAVLAAVPLTPLGYALGFAAFRVADTLKPWPLRRLERLPGGWGIMADDLGAGVYAGVAAALGVWLIGGGGW